MVTMNAFDFIDNGWAIDQDSEDKGLWHSHELDMHLVCVANSLDDELPTHCECGAEVPGEILAAYLDEVTT